MDSKLISKYNIPAPRYTSYPTVPYWDTEKPAQDRWLIEVNDAFSKNNAISLYIHLPYCEQLCTYCGCNKRITKNHKVERPYLETVLKEWQLYLKALPSKPLVREIHLGGGTPTFFQPENLRFLMDGILEHATPTEDHEFSFEAHPASTTYEHLKTMNDLGFKRISIGVQDFDEKILNIINRRQTTEDVVRVTRQARELGYTSINYDLIFGLPLQKPENIIANIKLVQQLMPERIAFYSYAHVPWIKPSQRAYSEADLPVGEEKRKLYELGKKLLNELGYLEIGMDHFALDSDALTISMKEKELHRNFMGYTPVYTRLMIGLGVSSISDAWGAFAQNEKTIEAYRKVVEKGKLPIFRGHMLTREDRILRKHILNIMCRFETAWLAPTLDHPALHEGLARMHMMEMDNLIERKPFKLEVTEKGRPFIRNICMALDARYWRKKPKSKLFSQVV